MNKEKETKEKTYMEKAKESFGTALMSAGIVLVVLLLLWIPFKIVPVILGNGTNFVATTLSSLFVSDNSTSTNIAVNTVTTSKTDVPAQTQKAYYGKPDLQVTLLGTGIIDPATKQFVETSYVGFNDEIATRFEVKNIGTNVSGPWNLRINTPSRTTPYYDSATQQSIKPGDKIVYTTSFNNPQTTGINTEYITADPLNTVTEDFESNNQITVPIKIEGTAYTYNNGYNYGNTAIAGNSYSWSSMNVNCYANPQTTYIGVPVTWYATVSGGNGYYSYSWSAADPAYPLYSNQSSATQTYYSSGTKVATVTVVANGMVLTKTCSAFIY